VPRRPRRRRGVGPGRVDRDDHGQGGDPVRGGPDGPGAAVRRNARALVATPRAFLTSPEYAWMFGLYATTYAAANAISTCCDRAGRDHTVT